MLTSFIVKHTPIRLLEFLEYVNLSSYKGTKFFLQNIPPDVLDLIGKRRALAVFQNSAKTIPAYKKFLAQHKVDPVEIKTFKDFSRVPATDKENYVSKYTFLEQCRGGKLPRKGLLVESSGSSGKPTNWIKDHEESKVLLKEVEFETEYLFKKSKNKYIVLSCWSLGPWTTDIKFCYFFEHVGIVKNIGPNIENVEATIKKFGPKYKYIIAGYPPFLKKCIEQAKIPWRKYNMQVITGGEGFVKGWRKYMLSKLGKGSKIYSAYGSSDLDTAVGIETPLCIYIKDLFDKKPKLVRELFDADEPPMLFQFDPTLHYIENIEDRDKREFSVTKLNSKIPNIMVKYNIHDRGGTMRFDELVTHLKKNVKGFAESYRKLKKDALNLPFLWIGGRTDSTLSINGTNVYPQQVESALLTNAKLYKNINTFQISKKYESKKTVHFMVKIELAEGVKPSAALKRSCQQTILKGMQLYSREYKQAMKEFPENWKPIVEIYAHHTGPFERQSIKNKYLER